MCERVIEGNIDVSDRKIAKLLEKQNELLKHQNTILSSLVDVIKEIR